MFRRKRGAFEKTISAIKIANTVGLPTKISFVPNKINYKSFEKLCGICYELGVREVVSMPLIPMGRGESLSTDDILLNSDEYVEFQQDIERLKDEYNKKSMKIEWGDPVDHIYRMPTNYALGVKTPCVEIRSDGHLTVSSYLPLVVGDLKKYTLKKYWEAGYNDVWGNKKVTDHISKIVTIDDYTNFEPSPYSGKDIVIDLLEN